MRHGRFRIDGLEPGGPAVVHVEAPGYHVQRSAPAQLRLGESVDIHFVLQPAALVIDTLRIYRARRRACSRTSSRSAPRS